ncbi:ABC transporter permease, partial [Streptococcus suis]
VIQAEENFKKDVLDKLGRSSKDVIAYRTGMVSLNYNDKKDVTVNDNNISEVSLATGFVYLISQDDFKRFGNSI